ncbi:MAG: PpiC-type peptidyl-prolyl cis-trans isomerase, partial [Bacteroidetes bacterium]|nr:PpiC-type peptidyl-prolyl cis-trans isomerase [Bacteroidota bacterium]
MTDKRASQGEVHVKHIFILDNDPNSKNKTELKARIDSLYQRVKTGDDFGELAKKHSQDPGSARQNGDLPWFGSGQMIPEFEKAAFSLKNPGDYSEPVRSAVGWHIIQLIEKRPL